MLIPQSTLDSPAVLPCCGKVTARDLVFRDHTMSCPSCGHEVKAPRFSPSRISVLQVPDFCPKCFFRLIKLNFKTAFDFGTPYIMQQLDRHQKRIANVALRQDGELPKFFGPFKAATQVVPVDWLSCFHPETNIQLFGYTDLVFEFEDGSVGIIDNKTAMAKDESHPLFHRYKAQTCLYKYMMEHGPSPRSVSQLGLLYYEFRRPSDDEMDDCYNDEEVWAPFTPRFVNVDGSESESLTNDLLKRLRYFLDLKAAPEGKDGCKDCKAVEEAWKRVSDFAQPSPSRFTDRRQYERALARWRYSLADGDRTSEIIELLRRSWTNELGVLANWDWSC